MRKIISILLLAVVTLVGTSIVIFAGKTSAPLPHQSIGRILPTAQQPISPPKNSTLQYGISADYLLFAQTAAGQAFQKRVLGQGGYVRVFIPYDATDISVKGQCVASPSATGGGAAFGAALKSLQQIYQLGLTPEVVFSSGSGMGASADPDPSNSLQATDYACGVSGIIRALWAQAHPSASANGATITMPLEYEAFNEPNLAGYLHGWNNSCSMPDQTPSCSGPWEAAMLWYIAQSQMTLLQQQGLPSLTVAALTISAPNMNDFLRGGHPTLDYQAKPVDGYYQSLWNIVHCTPGFGGCTTPQNPTELPQNWALHDYGDPTAGGVNDLRQFMQQLALLNNKYNEGKGANIWITESGVHLDSSFQTDANFPRGIACTPPVGVDLPAANTLGCRVDGNTQLQASGARDWLKLASVVQPTLHGNVRVNRLFWYQFQLQQLSCTVESPCQLGSTKDVSGVAIPALHSWDSSLIDASGDPRSSFCVLLRLPLSHCTGNPSNYTDAHWDNWWQSQAIPNSCPFHEGAWVADNPDSTVAGGEECYPSTNIPPTGRKILEASGS